MKKLNLDHPVNLLNILEKIFPTFRCGIDDPEITYHAVLQDFIVFYSTGNSTFTERQVEKFAAVVNQAVDIGGMLENAFATCFLEHVNQLHIRKPLISYLSPAARQRLRA